MAPQNKNRENKSLPARWRYRKGFYWYRVPVEAREFWDNKTEFKLGKTLAEAHRIFSERYSAVENVQTMSQLLDRYESEVVIHKAVATQKSNRYSLQRLRLVFGENTVASVTAQDGFKYRDHCAAVKSKKIANLDLEVLSHAMTKAVEWGVIVTNPIKGNVPKFSLKGRTRYVTDEELIAFGFTLKRKWQLYLSLKLFTGRRKAELLGLKMSDLVEEGIRFRNAKNKEDIFIVKWTPELRSIVEQIMKTRGRITSLYLFCTKKGQPYIKQDLTTSGFDSMWQRAQRSAIKNKVISESFTENDIRAKTSSDTSLEKATELLRHTNSKTTRKHYRRKIDQINPR